MILFFISNGAFIELTLIRSAATREHKAVNGKGALVGDGFVDLKRKVEGKQQQPRQGLAPRARVLESMILTEMGLCPYSLIFDSGSKDGMFFDSRAWLDSNCEDDFYSVNGDNATSEHLFAFEGMSDSELRMVLELAFDEELMAFEEILYGTRLIK
ncbi:hypothetical protein E2562_005804 [Oryza meyeriana var. granulata]|uniref:Uncharacterized protein n=1 Tax=Oryza meyeriana var. granulata TaxID=110450 RepID=A0A6G1F4P3_9ORYZ|nr:hypothetical protein E2562_005804 [Oryza meyeriana var. granulata]